MRQIRSVADPDHRRLLERSQQHRGPGRHRRYRQAVDKTDRAGACRERTGEA